MTERIPLLDMSDSCVRLLVEQALRHGFITIDALNSVLPLAETDPDSIEALLEWFSAKSVSIVE
jgi:RNA polymerase primary sigma factor